MKHKKKQKHLEGPCNTQEDTPQRQSPVEAAACRQAAGERPDFPKGFIGVFSPLKRPRLEKDGPYNTKDDAPQPKSPEEIPSCGQGAREKSAFSEPFVCVFSPSKRPRLHEDGRCVSQDNVPQPESPVEAAACSQAAGEKPAFSGHPTAVSTPSKRARPDEEEMKELPVSQHSEPTEDSSDYLQTYIPSHSLNKNEPFQSPVHGTDVRPMKMYYMRVQLERGVAVLFHTKEGMVPPSKKIKMEEMTYLGKVHKDVPFSHMSEKEHLIAREPMLDSRAQEKRGEADRPAQPPALSGYPRAKTPEWLVALDSGFRCMACCRVFPSLEVLQEHVECGVREGFSCHVFHRAMAHLKYKERMRKKKERKRKATFRF
ncbi:protein FAM170A-like [Eptesicus fuscus]|uniref:protein FAM170A-like n=1 Tax=Eptesicus fuscus TaxID=29078 RepID=UPI00240412DE|nr:protein FAM170A-like [Eptesicus fuscus]